MVEQRYCESALIALRAAYLAGQVVTEKDAQSVVTAAVQGASDAAFDGAAISELTAYCHRRLLRAGMLKRNVYGAGYVLKEAKPIPFQP